MEEQYKVTVYLYKGRRLKAYGPQNASSVEVLYQTLGAKGGRIKVPTAPGVWHYLPATAVHRVKAEQVS